MAQINFDPELMQDFLTESGELLEQLDADLVTLESTPQDADLVNRVFRALHTIKGSASFLQLTNLVAVAHAAETALNAARNRVFVIDRAAMDLLLAAVDTVKRQFENLRNAEDLVVPDERLVASLIALGEGKSPAPALAAPSAQAARAAVGDALAAPGADGQTTVTPFTLPPGKADLLDYLVADVESTLDQIDQQVARLAQDKQRAGACSLITDLADALGKSVEFFDVAPMVRLTGLLRDLGARGADLPADAATGVGQRASQVVELLREQSKGLSKGQLISRPLDALCEDFQRLLHEDAPADHAQPAAPAPAHVDRAQELAPAVAAQGGPAPSTGAPADKAHEQGEKHDKHAGAGEETIRVEVTRLESLLNLVGELVLQKNRVAALGRQLGASGWGTQDYREAVTQATGSLDRVTGDLQAAVMKTRMQPLDKIFGKYPRLIRDLARKLSKQINLVIEGGETEVDKSVIEQLGDPLIHLMRNSADHGIETPEARAAKGKPAEGTIRLVASHEGSHVQILIIDDGKGIDPSFIARKAVEKGVATQAQVDAMSDRERTMLIFAPGFSTAEKLSDVSGRGVGMDVVRTNIEKLKGTIDIESNPGAGTTMRIKIPLTVAIMAAMMVAVGPEIYAVPLASITEIVKPPADAVSTIRGHKVMRLRDTVLPLLDGAQLFAVPAPKAEAGQAAVEGAPIDCPFAVVLSLGEKRVGLMVTRLIGQQEVVIKPLDGSIDRAGPASGATVRDDGGVSLIVDIAKLFQIAESASRARAA